jgi:hypothetical protein
VGIPNSVRLLFSAAAPAFSSAERCFDSFALFSVFIGDFLSFPGDFFTGEPALETRVFGCAPALRVDEAIFPGFPVAVFFRAKALAIRQPLTPLFSKLCVAVKAWTQICQLLLGKFGR